MEEEYRRMAEVLKHDSVRPVRRIGFTEDGEEHTTVRRQRAARKQAG